MTSDHVRKFFTTAFVLIFFAYLFGPLIVMSLTAFNSAAFPRITPWECFSVEWFDVLVNDDKLVRGLRNSIFIALGVVMLAVPIGMAGALMLSQVKERVRPWYYTIVISPILVPGVVLGISTLLFWDRVGSMLGVTRDTIFYNGFFLTIIGQATFISAYTMLVFISRLQRFESTQEEAALDLGATHMQTFRKILLPFLKPAIASSAVLAFLASFENYNTTVFTILTESTITTFLAAKVRHGINPSVSALAVAIVVITLFGAALHEALKRRELAQAKEDGLIAKGKLKQRTKKRGFMASPALWMIVSVFVAGMGSAYFAGTMGVEECKTQVRAERQKVIQERIRKQQQKTMFKQAGQSAAAPTAAAAGVAAKEKEKEDKSKRAGVAEFNSIFGTANLRGQAGSAEKAEPEKPVAPVKRPGAAGYNNLFQPQNLEKQSGTE